MNANATQKYGAILEQMNLDKFASGGAVVPEPYVPTFKNPNIASNIIKQEAQKQNNNARMEELLGQQNLILTNIAKQDNSSGGNVTILNTRASKEEIFGELAKTLEHYNVCYMVIKKEVLDKTCLFCTSFLHKRGVDFGRY